MLIFITNFTDLINDVNASYKYVNLGFIESSQKFYLCGLDFTDTSHGSSG